MRRVDSSSQRFTLMTGIAILYLSWIGFKLETIPWIRKGDLIPSKCGIYDSMVGKVRSTPKSGYLFIEKYAQTPVCAGRDDLSHFLIRNRNHEQITLSGIDSAIRTLNSSLKYVDKNYSILAIYESGIFSRVYAKQPVLPIYNHGKRLTRENLREYERIFEREFSGTQALTDYLKRYHTFVKKFYGE